MPGNSRAGGLKTTDPAARLSGVVPGKPRGSGRRSATVTYPVLSVNRANSALVTGARSIQNPSTSTACTGSASDRLQPPHPIQNRPPGIQTIPSGAASGADASRTPGTKAESAGAVERHPAAAIRPRTPAASSLRGYIGPTYTVRSATIRGRPGNRGGICARMVPAVRPRPAQTSRGDPMVQPAFRPAVLVFGAAFAAACSSGRTTPASGPAPAAGPASAATEPDASAIPPGLRIQPSEAFTAAMGRGTRTATGQPGPRYWQQYARYNLQAELQPLTKRLVGKSTVTYLNRSPDALPLIYVHAYHNL